MVLGTWIGAGVLAVSLGGWGLYERNERLAAQNTGATLSSDLKTRTQQLNETASARDEALAKLDVSQRDLRDLNTKYVTEGQKHVSDTDKLLARINDGQKQLKDLDAKIAQSLAELQALDAYKTTLETQLQAQQDKNMKLQALSAAEKDAAKLAIDAQRRQLNDLRTVAQKQDEALKETQRDLTQTQKEAQVNEELARAAQQQNQNLNSDLTRASQDRDAYARGMQQAQVQTAVVANQARSMDWQLQKQASEITRLQQKLNFAQAEIERLKKLLPPGTK
jgi:chromosome segregation ATPase